MKIKLAEKTVETDKYYLVRVFDLLAHDNDIHRRDADVVEDYYRSDWFPEGDFELPAFYLQDGKVFFINGRHRTVVLSRVLDSLPMALTSIDAASADVLSSMVISEMNPGDEFELPNLRIEQIEKETFEVIQGDLPILILPKRS